MQNEYRLYDTRELERELGVHASNSSGFSGFAFALGALVRRRARKGPKAKGVDRSVLVLLLIVVTALGLLSGCGACDDEQLTLEQPPFQCGTERTTGEFGEVVCPGTPDDPEEPQADFAGGGGDLGGMQTDGGTVREEMGLDDIKAPAKPKSGHREESLAATAVDKPTNNKLTPFTPTGGKGGSGEGGGPNLALPQLGKSGPGKDAESGSNITGSAGVGLAATAESKEEKPAAGEAEPETTFADAGGAGKGAGGAGVGGFGGFGESGPTGGGADVAAYGTGDGDTLGGGGSMEDYLSKVGRTSLFEVVNRRTEKFNIQIDAHAATGEFRKMTR